MSAILPIVPVNSPSQHSFDGDADLDKKHSSSDESPSDSEADAQSLASTQLAEKRFLRRLDVFLLTWGVCSHLIKIMDAQNYKVAFASGMKEEMKMFGNELNYMDTTWRVGYALSLIPSQYALLKIRPSIWLPALECAWGIMTLLMAFAHSVNGMYALRFFIGVFEASSYPGITCVLCSWYTPAELATRLAIFGTSYPLSNIVVSSMQAALHKGMDGKGGLAGWKWLFIWNGIMTVIVAVSGFFLLPDNPGTSKVWWLTPEQNELSRTRMVKVNKEPVTFVSAAKLKKIFLSYKIYLFSFAYATWSWSQNSTGYTILFVKSLKNALGKQRYGVSELNAIMIPGYFLQIIAMLICGWGSGKYGSRIVWIIGQMASILLGQIILAIWPPSEGLKFFAYFILWCSNAVGPILIAWMSDLCPSPEERATIIAIAITFVFIIDAWANILVYPTKQAPRYQGAGFKVAACFTVLSTAVACVWWYMDRRTGAARRAEEEAEREEKPTTVVV